MRALRSSSAGNSCLAARAVRGLGAIGEGVGGGVDREHPLEHPARGLRPQQRTRRAVVTFARGAHQRFHHLRHVGGARAAELLADRREPLHVFGPGGPHSAHHEILEALLQLEQGRGDLGVLFPHRA